MTPLIKAILNLKLIHIINFPFRNLEVSTYFPKNKGFPGGSDGKEFACNAGDLGLIPGLGRSPRGGLGNPLQYSCLGESPWTKELRGLQSMGSQRVGHD